MKLFYMNFTHYSRLSKNMSASYMCLKVKISPSLFHPLSVEITVELSSFFSCFLYVLRHFTGFNFLRILLLHLLKRKKSQTISTHRLHYYMIIPANKDITVEKSLMLTKDAFLQNIIQI